MTTINDRIGSQNVIRVLSNASAPPTRLANLSDVNSTRKTEDGLVLVWDLVGEKFVLTDTIDAATIIQTGITSFSNVTNSTSPTTGALKIAGGVGIEKNLNIAANLQVTGLSTFVGVVTTSNDLYVGGDLYVKDDIVYDEVNGRQINISGIGTFGSINIGAIEIVSSSRELKNVTSFDNTTTSTVQNVIFSGGTPNTFDSLNITGIATFLSQTNINTLSVTGVTTTAGLLDINAGGQANTFKVEDLTAGRIVLAGTGGELEDSSNLTFNGSLLTVTGALTATGTLTAGLIDGGSY